MESAFFLLFLHVHRSLSIPLLSLLLMNTSATHLMLECKLYLLQCVEKRIKGTVVLISKITLGIINFKELFIMLYITSICIIRLFKIDD